MKKLMRKKLALMLATLKKKRKYYCECEYLESTGTQYINTGYKPNTNTRTVGRFCCNSFVGSSANYIFGVYSSPNNYGLNVGSARQYFNVPWGSNSGISLNGLIPQLNTDYEFDISKTGYLINGQSYGTISSESVNSARNMYLFWSNGTSASGMNGRIYYLKIYDNGALVRDFIPVLDWSYVPCMYDRVSGKLFYNQGTGSFSYGREIHYVDYIESTGTQYIDTGVKLTNNHSVELDYQLTQASQSRAGLYGNLATARYGTLLSPSNRYLEFGYGTSNLWYQKGLPDTNRHIINQKKNNIYFDGSLLTSFTYSTFSIVNTAPLGSFGYTNYTPAKAKYYGSKWWYNDDLIRDYKPAIDENGVGFMFDRVTHSIFDNAGTGVFKYPPVELEYLESDSTAYIDTGISGANNNLKIEMDFSYSKFYAYAYFFSNYESEEHNTTRFLLDSSNNSRGLAYINTKSQNGAIYTPYNLAVNDKHNIILTKTTVSIDGVIATNTNPPAGTANTKSIVLFNRGAGSYADKRDIGMKCYYFRIYDNDALILNFIPAYKDGQAGMLDKANNVFYPNAGTGTFLTGKIIEKEYG